MIIKNQAIKHYVNSPPPKKVFFFTVAQNRNSPWVTAYGFVSVLYMSYKNSTVFKRINQYEQEGI